MALIKMTANGPVAMPAAEETAMRTAWAQHHPGGLRAGVIEQILQLEAQQTRRRMRDFALGRDNGWLAALDTQIAALRALLPS